MQTRSNEAFYGLGEVSGMLNRDKRRFRINSSDAMGYDAETTDPLYKHWPLFFTVCKEQGLVYGLLYDTFQEGVVDLGKEVSAFKGAYRYAQFNTNALTYYLFIGTTLKEVQQTVVKLVGPTALPPFWAQGYLGSAMAYSDMEDAQEKIEGTVILIPHLL